MLVDGVKVFVQNGKLDDNDVAYYINRIKQISKGKELQRISFIIGDEYIDLRYLFKGYPFERIWRIPHCEGPVESVV